MQISVNQSVERLIGNSDSIRQALIDLDYAARSGVSVLVTGEHGIGKTLTARLIHDRSPRRLQPCLTVQCHGVPETQLASELFGHDRCELGTLILDGVGQLSPALQEALLYFLETGEAPRLGNRAEGNPSNVQVIACANESLVNRIVLGQFSEALFYRLNVIHIYLPPLRTRPEDVPVLLDHFLGRLALEQHVVPPRITKAASAILASYPWPGNVEQLQRLSARLVESWSGRAIEATDLPREIFETRPSVSGVAEVCENRNWTT